ncbi:uncharacterized protein [Spinacia oleracea]|uniref:Reverse transcriptase zinc-binding domain-containing protein n=1 Tax=Spinacia oleracea TaxID=3562 RepID=A0ABM3R3I1_SPIOL|nr:uncharacterized protein LOC130465421 [Spinacia oleracea]
MDKSNIYIGGVYGDDKAAILDSFSIPAGSFPFRYLGVPLTTKKLVTACSNNPVESSIILVPDIHFDQKGGLNLKDMCIWNKAAVAKLLWAITYKKDKPWCKWVHTYYIKGRDIRNVQWPKSISWSLKKVLGSQKMIDDAEGWSVACKTSSYSIKAMYQRLLGPYEKVRWRRLIWQNKASPKSLFIAWVAIWGRLPTLDRLIRWKVVDSNIFPLSIWSYVLRSLQFTRAVGKNAKVFTGSCRSPHEMLKDIKFRVACRASDSQQQLLLD